MKKRRAKRKSAFRNDPNRDEVLAATTEALLEGETHTEDSVGAIFQPIVETVPAPAAASDANEVSILAVPTVEVKFIAAKLSAADLAIAAKLREKSKALQELRKV